MKLIGLTPGHRVRLRMKEMPRIRVEGNNTNTDASTTPAITATYNHFSHPCRVSTHVRALAHAIWWVYYYPISLIRSPRCRA